MVAIPPDHIADILQEPFAENAARAELPAWHRLNQDQALPVALVEERGGLRVVREPHRIDPHAFEQACLPALRLIGGGQPDIWILLVAVDAPELERLSVERKSLLRDLGETDARRFLIGIFLAVFIGYTAGQGIQSRVIRAPQAGVLDVENRREAGASAGRHPGFAPLHAHGRPFFIQKHERNRHASGLCRPVADRCLHKHGSHPLIRAPGLREQPARVRQVRLHRIGQIHLRRNDQRNISV